MSPGPARLKDGGLRDDSQSHEQQNAGNETGYPASSAYISGQSLRSWGGEAKQIAPAGIHGIEGDSDRS